MPVFGNCLAQDREDWERKEEMVRDADIGSVFVHGLGMLRLGIKVVNMS